MRKGSYILSYTVVIIIIFAIYTVSNVKGDAKKEAVFATRDLPPGAILTEADLEFKEGNISESEKSNLTEAKIKNLIGKEVSGFGLRKDRPVLVNDVSEKNRPLFEMKLVGDITIPEDAKIVDILLIYDNKKFPDRQMEKLAGIVPVQEIYNHQNVPVNAKDNKNKVPRVLSVLVTEEQREIILNNKNKGELHFSTMP